MKLLKVDTVETAGAKIIEAMKDKYPENEIIDISEANGRYLAEDIYAGENVPAFNRSIVDGYAVIASNTSGAGENVPVFLNIVGDVNLGNAPEISIKNGECVYVPTGGQIPSGADAMVMIEYCEAFDISNIALYTAVAHGSGIVTVGEDMKCGDLVVAKGTRIRPQEIGALAALGITRVSIYKPWRVDIISTGDELVSPEKTPLPGQIRDINTFSLCALAEKHGLEVGNVHVLKDDTSILSKMIRTSMPYSDIIIISGGSSQGKKDMTNMIIDQVASEGVFTHGIALKPGKPTILGYDMPTETLLVGLPGHPVAALLVLELLIKYIWKDKIEASIEHTAVGYMSTNLAGEPGRKTCQLVKLTENGYGNYDVIPILGKSGLISTLTRADGYVMIHENQEGLNKGDRVVVHFI